MHDRQRDNANAEVSFEINLNLKLKGRRMLSALPKVALVLPPAVFLIARLLVR